MCLSRCPERQRSPPGAKIDAHTSGAPASSRVGQRSAIAREAHRAARRALAGALLARLQRLRPNSYVIGGGRRVLGRLGRRPAAAALLHGLSRHRVARAVSVAHRAKGQRRRKRARARQPARGNGERPSRVRARRHTPAPALVGSAKSARGCASATVFERFAAHQTSACPSMSTCLAWSRPDLGHRVSGAVGPRGAPDHLCMFCPTGVGQRPAE